MPEHASRIRFFGPQQGLACGNDPSLKTDAEHTWAMLQNAPPGIVAVRFFGSDRGMVTRYDSNRPRPLVYRTDDGGETWHGFGTARVRAARPGGGPCRNRLRGGLARGGDAPGNPRGPSGESARTLGRRRSANPSLFNSPLHLARAGLALRCPWPPHPAPGASQGGRPSTYRGSTLSGTRSPSGPAESSPSTPRRSRVRKVPKR